MAAAGGPSLMTLNLVLNDQPLVQFRKQAEKSLGMTTNEMRMLGRDVLRLGGILTHFGTIAWGIFNSIKSASFSLGGALENISWIFEDIGEIIGEAMAPAFDFLAEILEPLVDAFERLPEPLQAFLGFAVLAIALVLTLGRHLTVLAGSVLLFARSISSGTLSLRTIVGAFKELIGMSSQVETSNLELISLENQKVDVLNRLRGNMGKLSVEELKLSAMEKDLGNFTDKSGSSFYEASYAVDDQKKRLKDLQLENTALNDRLGELNVQIKNTKEGLEGTTGAAKGGKKGLGGLASGIGKVVLGFMGMTVLMVALGPIMDALSPVFEGISDAMEPIAEAIQPWAEALGDLISENPELFAQIIMLLIGLIAIMKILPIITKLFSFLGGVFGGIAGTAGEVGEAQQTQVSSTYKNIAAIGVLVIAIAALIASFALLLDVATKANIPLNDLIIFIVELVGSMLLLVGGLAAIAFGLSKAGGSIMEASMALTIMILAVAGLVAAFSLFIGIAGVFGYSMNEVIGMIYGLVTAIVFAVGMLVAIGIIAMAASVPLGFLTGILMALSIAALSFGIAILFAGVGIAIGAKALAGLLSNLPQLLVAIPALLALAASFLALGAALAFVAPFSLASAVGILVLSVAVLALAGAIKLLVETLKEVPDWAKGFVGGLFGAIGGIFGGLGRVIGGIPGLQKGGEVVRGGVAYLHPAEVVTPAGQAGGFQQIYNTFDIHATIREEADIDTLASKISKLQSRDYHSTVYG